MMLLVKHSCCLDYVIIGTGKERVPLVESIYERFTKKGIKVDVLPTVNKGSQN